MKLIAPSILAADFCKLGDEVRSVQDAGADWVHVDVMDGHFVPNITMGPSIVKAVKRATSLPIDVHLMIENPGSYIFEFADAGADYISIQVEVCHHLNRTIEQAREAELGVGVVLNPATPLSAVEWVLESIDFVLIMSVNPGFGGQHFIHHSLDKIKMLKEMIMVKGLNTRIQVDGGVNEENAQTIAQAGADIFVAGSAIFKSSDYHQTIKRFRELIGK
jgi:ribulose-phosphate 3-epimerase